MSDNFDLDFDGDEAEEAPKQKYQEPEEQQALNEMFESFTVKKFKKGVRPEASIHQTIGYASFEAYKAHADGGWYTRIYGNVPLEFKGRDRGYGLPEEGEEEEGQ